MKNNFWKGTLLYGLGFVALRAISFILLPFFTTVLSPSIAGEVFIFFTFLAFMNAFFAFGMDSALLKFHNKHDNTFSTSIISVFFFAFPCSLVLFFFHESLSLFLFSKDSWSIILFGTNLQWIIYLIIILSVDAFSSRCMTLLRSLERPIYYLSVCLINVILTLVLTVYFVKNIPDISFRLDGVIKATCVVACIQFLVLFPVVFSNLYKPLFSFALFKKMFKVAWPFFPATIFFIIIELSDRIIIDYYYGLAMVGMYGASAKIGALILMAVRAFNLNWQPYYLKQGKKYSDNLKMVVPLFSNIGTMFIVFLITIIVLCSAWWPHFIPLIVGEEFQKGGIIIPIIALAYGFFGVFILQMPSIFLKNKYKWAPWLWGVGACINIFGNFILIPLFGSNYGYVGASIATLLAYATMAIFLTYLNESWLKIEYNNKLINYALCYSALFLVCFAFASSAALWVIVLVSLIYGFAILSLFNRFKNITL